MRTYDEVERKSLRELWRTVQNVRDEFKGLTVEEIRAELQPKRNNLQILFYNAIRDFNFSATVRASNAFACQSIVYSGYRRYDPRAAVGTHNYENIIHIEDHDLFKLYIQLQQDHGWRFVVAESDKFDKSIALPKYKWNEHTMLMLGEESVGVDPEFIEMADDIVYVPQFGSVRSLNVASAGHIMIYDYMQKTGRLNG